MLSRQCARILPGPPESRRGGCGCTWHIVRRSEMAAAVHARKRPTYNDTRPPLEAPASPPRPLVPTSKEDPAIGSLAEQIMEAEAALKALFDPGRTMPSAGTVAKRRQAIMDMKALLAAKLNGNVPVDPDASDTEAERARKLFFELQVERSLQRQQRSSAAEATRSVCTSSSFELTLLEVENEQLREKAEALLLRQQQLEDLAEVHKLITREEGRVVWIGDRAAGEFDAGTREAKAPPADLRSRHSSVSPGSGS